MSDESYSLDPHEDVMTDRLLYYIPNHGLGMELYTLEDAVQLACLLDRTLVVPRIPHLETHTLDNGLESYFDIDHSIRWISTTQAMKRPIVDTVYRILPYYRPTFTSESNRSLHPVWVDNIVNYSYFKHLGLTISHVDTVTLPNAMTKAQALATFLPDDESIGLTFINGLVPSLIPAADRQHTFAGRLAIPTKPNSLYIEEARRRYIPKIDVAFHVRRGNLQTVARQLHGTRLPSIEAYLNSATLTDSTTIYVATDSPDILSHFPPQTVSTDRTYGSPTDQVVRDIAVCISARYFVGTKLSTLSSYIYHCRTVNLGLDQNTSFPDNERGLSDAARSDSTFTLWDSHLETPNDL